MDDHSTLKNALVAQWEAMAEDWIRQVEDGATSHREGMLDEWMLDAVGDVTGRKVIDLGCGEGRFSRMLAERGALVTGVDLCRPFIEYAKTHRVAGESYLIGDIEDLHDVASAVYDLAVSYVTLVDVPNMQSAVGEAFRVLRPGGRFVVCNLHPMASASPGWITQEGRKLHRQLDCYFDEGERTIPLQENRSLVNFHRTLSTHIRTFLDVGFVVEDIREPTPTEEQARQYPVVSDNLRVPDFIIYVLRKP